MVIIRFFIRDENNFKHVLFPFEWDQGVPDTYQIQKCSYMQTDYTIRINFLFSMKKWNSCVKLFAITGHIS